MVVIKLLIELLRHSWVQVISPTLCAFFFFIPKSLRLFPVFPSALPWHLSSNILNEFIVYLLLFLFRRRPRLLQLGGYLFCFHNCMIGPSMFFADYLRFIEGQEADRLQDTDLQRRFVRYPFFLGNHASFPFVSIFICSTTSSHLDYNTSHPHFLFGIGNTMDAK